MKASQKFAEAAVVLAVALAVILVGETLGLPDRTAESRTLVLRGGKVYLLQMLPRLRMVSSLCAIRKSLRWENVAKSLMGAQPGSWIAPEWL
jgi:hypothetical protein